MAKKALFDRVVLKQLVAEETTKSGIVLPGQAKEKPQEAEVIAVGPGGIIDGKEVTMQGLCKYGCGCGSVAGHVVGLRSHFTDELCSHVLKSVFQFDLFCDGHAVVCDQRSAERLIQYYVPSLRSQCHADGKEVTMQVKAGDRVIYSKYAGTDVELDDEKFIIVKQNDILAIVEA